jgi:hypothetical protein
MLAQIMEVHVRRVEGNARLAPCRFHADDYKPQRSVLQPLEQSRDDASIGEY